MRFERFFRLISYTAVFCGFLSLWISGTFGGISTGLFIGVVIAAWSLEESRWQISERVGTTLIVLALPAFYFAWRYHLIDMSGTDTVVAGILARMILSLTAVKLLQKKSDRDWIFLYLMAFFEVLLAAGLSISALYVLTFITYLLIMVCTVIAFELRKTSTSVENVFATSLGPNFKPDRKEFPRIRLPLAAIILVGFIVLLAVPLFFMLPRVSGAGFGGSQAGLNTSTGFSDFVRLGGIGNIQQNDEIVMRVKIEGNSDPGGLYFRGVALDTFDNQAWSRSRSAIKEPYVKGDRDMIQLDPINGRDELTIQTIYLEPLDTPVLFGLPRIVAVQGNMPIIERDEYGALSYKSRSERVTYKLLSDRTLPDTAKLRQDNGPYSADAINYLELPEKYDRRIFDLAYSITSKEKNRYDRAVAVERYLQNNFGYTLEQKSGGSEPLADFLFNVREGHCEYFATAMAVMLRTQGVATRVVNGFHGGDYNDAVDMTVVRQRNAHSWVEVYFPTENAWVPFDPTPFSDGGSTATGGFTGNAKKYLEALETFWIQHFVAYDDQEQRSLARSLKSGISDYQQDLASYFQHSQALFAEWWRDVRGDAGTSVSLFAIAKGVASVAVTLAGLLILGWVGRKIVKWKVWRRLGKRHLAEARTPIVDFYERLQQALAARGFSRSAGQTPLEFAFDVGMPAAVRVTEKYNRVRYGERSLSPEEADEVESLLTELESKER